MQEKSERLGKDTKASESIGVTTTGNSQSPIQGLGVGDVEMERTGVSDALAAIFSWKNYRVYLVTAWVFSAAITINSFFNLYFRAIGWDYTSIGAVVSITTTVSIMMRIMGGYVGDTVDRKYLAVLAMALGAVYFLLIGMFTEPWMVILALLVYASIDIAKGGSSAYILDNMPKEHSGFGLALFNAGRALGVVTLIFVNLLLPIYGFPDVFRIMSMAGGISLVICSVLRGVYLDNCPPKGERKNEVLWRDFLAENWRTIRVIAGVLPGAIIIISLDAFSDALFNFGALLYANEYLGVSISGISIMLSIILIVSVPLTLKVGRLSDRWGIRKVSLVIYSVMPLCMALLVIAPIYPTWAPQSWIDSANSFIDGLGVIYTTVFVAIVLKRVNDSLWWLVISVMIQKLLPHKDTAKFLAAFWYIVYIFMSIGPLVGGIIFTYVNQPTLFVLAFIINIIILISIYSKGLVNYEAATTTTTTTEQTS